MELDRWADTVAGWHPVHVDRQRCLPLLSPRSVCDACATICPEGAITPGLAVRDCSTCGLCAAVCQADAITLDNPSDQELLRRFAEGARRSSRLVLTCSQSGQSGLSIGCLGRLSPELLLAAVACGHEQIDLIPGECTGCPYAAGLSLLGEALDSLQPVLRHLNPPCQIRLTGWAESGARRPVRGEPIPPPVYEERRAFLLAAFGLLREMLPLAPRHLPSDPAQVTRPSKRREILLWALEQVGSVHLDPLPWGRAGVKLAGACHRCGVCQTLCPNGAIRLEGHPHGECLALDPRRCHGCGLCTQVCPVGALVQAPPQPLGEIARGGFSPLGQPAAFACSHCGQETVADAPPNTVLAAPRCLACSLHPSTEVVLR